MIEMSTNGTHTHTCPATERFKVRDQEAEIPLLDAVYDLGDIWERHKDNAVDGQRRYLDDVREYFASRYGLTLNYGEAEWLAETLGNLHLAKKNERKAVTDSLLRSLSSTGSAPQG